MKTDPNLTRPHIARSHQFLFAPAAFMLGIALTCFWIHTHQARAKDDGLSDSTRNLLAQISTPVIIRYYSLLPAGSVETSLQAFAGRTTHLLNAMQAVGGGKIQLISFETLAETNSNAASAAGLEAFNLDKGDACFLGLVIASGNNHETFARLQPEWEGALEFDIARAIQRVAASSAPPRPAPEVEKPDAQIIATINRLVPDMSAVSSEQADQIFHAEFLKQCDTVGAEMAAKIKTAQETLVAAQNNGSPEEAIEAAWKNLLAVQLARAEKFKQIAADLQTQLAVFEQMKRGTNEVK